MEIKQVLQDKDFYVTVSGRLDSNTAPQLEECLKEKLSLLSGLYFDFTDLEYISSAGLRILLGAQKKIHANGGTMIIRHANDMVRDVFAVTGMMDIFTLE